MKLHLLLASCSLFACRHDTPTEAPAAPEPAAVEAPAPAPAAPEPVAPHVASEEIVAPTSEPEPPPVEAPPAAPPSLLAVDGANVSVSDTEADGLHLTELACAVDRPLFGTLAVIGALSKQAKAFDRCAPRGDAAVLHWTFASGRTQDVAIRGASSQKVEACITAALKKVQSPMDARCGAVIHVGDEAGAREAHAGLTPE